MSEAQHTFQVLTKRAERMAAFFTSDLAALVTAVPAMTMSNQMLKMEALE